MAKKNSNDRSGKATNRGGSSEKRNINESGKKSYQPTVDRTAKPPKKDGE